MLARKTLSALATVMLAASLVGAPALAKCGRDCKKVIATDFKSCKVGCANGSAGRACKKTCRDAKKADITTCKGATNPTPPLCGGTTTATTAPTTS